MMLKTAWPSSTYSPACNFMLLTIPSTGASMVVSANAIAA